MIVTSNWLKDFVDFDLSAEELSHRLTMVGLEIDAMEKLGEGLDTVIVARLASVEQHPEADRLTLCQVETGSATVQVVCGATNHKTGDLVALAQVGSILPGDFKIKKSKIRGVESQGMLCSEKELHLAEESAGIMILPPGLTLGQPVFSALGLKDVRLELGLTPNRADCLSVVGVAREVAAMVGKSVHVPSSPMDEQGRAIENETSVTIEQPKMCPRYSARLIKGVKIGPSPDWLVRRLEAVGMRSISNVVDVTNYVLLELGHPLHAFDFNLLRGRKIVVKEAQAGSSFTTLDSQVRLLQAGDLVICDAEGPVALAGIMGGENSEIGPETVDILLESAYFDPMTIRRTSKRLGIHSESSHRFERGADIDMVPVALDRAASLILEVAGGTLAQGSIDNYPHKIPARKITITAKRTAEILGINLDALEIKNLLSGLGLKCQLDVDRADGALTVDIPAYRHDLEREIDLIEEVARLNGFDKIPTTMPASRMLAQPVGSREYVSRLRNQMVAAGFAEVINYSFISPGDYKRIGLPENDPRHTSVAIVNPLTEDQSVMRTTLVPSLLDTLARNLSYRSRDLGLFELRPVFLPCAGQELPVESLRLTAVLCGRRAPEGWNQAAEVVDFYDIKGVAEALCQNFHLADLAWDNSASEPFLHPGKSCTLSSGKQVLGTLGEVHPQVLEEYDIDLPVYLLDLAVPQLISGGALHGGFKPLSRFPDVYRDSAFLLDEAVPAQAVLDLVRSVKIKDLEDVVLFDLYRGKGIPETKKSIAVRLRYRSMEKTLTDEEVTKAHGKVVQALVSQLGAEIR